MRRRARIEVRSCVISPPKHRLILRPRLSYHERLTERDPGGEKPAISGRTENENRQVQERLGHTTIGITLDTYSHVVGSLQREAADRLDEVLG
jgi:integrase